MEKVFAYGTLRPPRPDTDPDDSRYYPQIAPYVQDAIAAQLPGADLYDLGAYPAARPGQGKILGELLTVAATALAILDHIEGHPSFYRREKATVQTESGEVEAWVYWAPTEIVARRLPIPGGDWFQRRVAPAEDAIPAPVSEMESQVAPIPDPVLERLVARFAEAAYSWLSTSRPGGRAHATPVWHVWDRGRVYVLTTSSAVKVDNVLTNPGVVITHPDPVDPIILEGWATLANAMRARLRSMFKSKYDWDIDGDPEYDTVIEITPIKLMAWGKHGEGRWMGSALASF